MRASASGPTPEAGRVRDVQVRFWATRAEWDTYRNAALAAKLDLSEWIRRRLRAAA